MIKKNVSLASVAKKPGSYVTDMETLKAEIQEDITKDQEKSEFKATEQRNDQNNNLMSSNFNVNHPQKLVGLNILIPQEMREQFKVKSIINGKKMKDILLELIQNYIIEN